MKIISIILVAYNPNTYIESCLNSIFNQGFKDYEVIAIDNTPNGEAAAFIRNRYPDVALIENHKNVGPCRARNQGIAKTEGEFILCLDDDVILDDDFLINIYKAIKSDRRLSAIQPKILMSDRKTIYSTGIYSSFSRRFYDIGSGIIDNGRFSQKRYVFGASCAAVFYRRESLETIRQGREYFDEDLFYLFEDIDLSWRLRRIGWRILYYPDATCFHKSGASRNKDKLSQYLCFRNRYLLLAKNESFAGFLQLPIVFFVYDLWRNLFMLITNPRYFLKASYEVIRLMPKMFKKRRYG